MTILDVSVKTIDRSAPFLPPSRTIEIKTRKGDIVTPTRASTSYEFKRKAQVPTDIPIESDISVNIQKLNYKNIKNLLTTNGYLDKLSRRIDYNNRLEQYSKLRIFLLQPTTSKSRDSKTNITYPPGMDLLRNNSEDLNKFLRILINTQYRMGLDLITIPFLDLPLSTLKNIIMAVEKTVEKINCYPFFVIDMKYSGFSQIINYIIENTHSKLIGLIFRDYLKCVQSYETLSKIADKDIAFFAMQVDRFDFNREDISVMHYLPFLANDIFSVEVPNQFVPKQDKTKKEFFDLKNIKLFDRSSLQIKEISSYSNLDEKISNEYRHDGLIREMLENFTDSATNRRKYDMLNSFSKVDEIRSSLSEFDNLQKYINQESSKDYLQEKTTLNRILKPMSHNKFEWFG